MLTGFAATFGVSLLLLLALGTLRSMELAAGRRFFMGRLRRGADEHIEAAALRAWRRAMALERRVVGGLRVLPHHAADLASHALRFVVTRSLWLLRWLHERRTPTGASRGSVSFFVSALGEYREQTAAARVK